jgi:peptide subunit release factor 1 (eRF1)
MNSTLPAIVQTLSAEPRTAQPFLSVYLDWTTDSSGKRPALTVLQQELDRIGATFEPRSEQLASFEQDRAEIMRYLDEDAPRDARGIAIFACDAERVWVTIPLLVPFETTIAVDGFPHVFPLARVIDDYETVVVARAEGQDAEIFVLGLDRMQQVATTSASEEINRVQVGGWSQLRYQNHNDFVIRAHMQDLAATIERTLNEYRGERLIVIGNDAIKGPLLEALPASLQQRMIGFVSFDRTADAETLYNGLEPLLREAEDIQEVEHLQRWEDQMATKGGLACAGIDAVATALSKGQVDTLLIETTFAAEGRECPSCAMLFSDSWASCPYDGSALVPVPLREAFTARALGQSGSVQVLALRGALSEHAGVGALLRYRDDVDNTVGAS